MSAGGSRLHRRCRGHNGLNVYRHSVAIAPRIGSDAEFNAGAFRECEFPNEAGNMNKNVLRRLVIADEAEVLVGENLGEGAEANITGDGHVFLRNQTLSTQKLYLLYDCALLCPRARRGEM
jgi:hypothetical protein